MKKLITRSKMGAWLAAMVLAAGCCLTSAAQNVQVNVWTITSPDACAATEQPVVLTVRNLGTEDAQSFDVKVFQNETLKYEGTVNEELKPYTNVDVTLPVTLSTPYASTNKITVTAVSRDSEGTEFTHSLDKEFTMPTPVPFPVLLTSENMLSVFKPGGLNWKWNPDQSNTFVVSGKGTGWGGGITSEVIDFPADKTVDMEMNISVSTDVNLEISAWYSATEHEVVKAETISPSPSGKFEPYSVIFKPGRPAQIHITAKMVNGGFFSYGEMRLQILGLREAVPDLAADAIIEPSVPKLCVDPTGYTVKAVFSNPSGFDIDSPTFGFKAGDQPEVREQYNGVIKAGETIEYTFAAKMMPKLGENVELKVFCSHPSDPVDANNSITAEYSFYEAKAFPYFEPFENGLDDWNIIDTNKDGLTWQQAALNETDKCAGFNSSNLQGSDYLVSPGIMLPAGKSRVSFYVGFVTGQANLQLNAYVGKTPLPDDKSVKVYSGGLSDTESGLYNEYYLLDVPEQGVYYLTLEASGVGLLIVNDVKFDREEDLCIEKVAFTEASGYNKASSKVAISYINHGVSPQSNIRLEYYVNDEETPVASEVNPATVMPGETITYVFNTPVDISEAGSTYWIIGRIATEVGTDALNDRIRGKDITHFKNKTVPYFNDFDTFVPGTWQFGPNWNAYNSRTYAYSPNNFLRHVGLVEAGKVDWAFSECIELPKGEYEISLMYRTEKNYATDIYKQNLRMGLFTEASPEALKQEVFAVTGLIAPLPWYKKIVTKAEVKEDGKLYIGLGADTPDCGADFGIFIEDLSIVPVEKGASLPYASNFETEPWTAYNSARSGQGRWLPFTDDDNAAIYRAERPIDFKNMQYINEDKLVSPKLDILPEKDVDIIVEYTLAADDAAQTLDVFGSTVNNPGEMKYLGSLPVVEGSAYATKTITIVPELNGESGYYLGFRTNSPEIPDNQTGAYDARIKSVKVDYSDSGSAADIAVDNGIGIVLNGSVLNVVTANGFDDLSIYSPYGTLVMQARSGSSDFSIDCSQLTGLYLVSVRTATGRAVCKMTF